jgi:hypothetical protein
MLPGQITDTIKAEWAKAGKPLPEKPTYKAKILEGTPEEYEEVREHDEKSITQGTPKEVAVQEYAWRSYLINQAEFQGEYSTRLMKKIFLAVATEPTAAWREEMEFVGIALETKGSAKERYQFAQSEVVQSMDDIADLQVAVMRLAGIIEEAAVDAAKASFRSLIRQAVSEAGGPKTTAGDVASQPVL